MAAWDSLIMVCEKLCFKSTGKLRAVKCFRLKNDVAICVKKPWWIRTKRQLGKTTTPMNFFTQELFLRTKMSYADFSCKSCSTLLKATYGPLIDLCRTLSDSRSYSHSPLLQGK